MTSITECVNGASSVAVAGHVRPDGDSVGACLAVANFIRETAPDIRVDVYLEPFAAKFLFLPHADQTIDPRSADPSQTYDVFFALDCGDEERLGAAAPFFRSAGRTVCVDHHLTNTAFADINEVDAAASSASEMAYRMMEPDKISEAVAECLYLGIAQDTGVFQYACTSPETMRVAADLMERGIPHTQIINESYANRTYAQQRIWGKVLRDSTLYLDGRCIVAVVTREDMKAYGATAQDLDGVVGELRATDGVEVAVFLYETRDGYKLSMRSAGQVDVAKIAQEYGGGGHARAAGASVGNDPEEIRDQLIRRIAEQL